MSEVRWIEDSKSKYWISNTTIQYLKLDKTLYPYLPFEGKSVYEVDIHFEYEFVRAILENEKEEYEFHIVEGSFQKYFVGVSHKKKNVKYFGIPFDLSILDWSVCNIIRFKKLINLEKKDLEETQVLLDQILEK